MEVVCSLHGNIFVVGIVDDQRRRLYLRQQSPCVAGTDGSGDLGPRVRWNSSHDFADCLGASGAASRARKIGNRTARIRAFSLAERLQPGRIDTELIIL